ncbi:MAG: hypothetical protein LW809_04055 [Vampirovibrionales bacterium]|jgi:hypothetical protein|nr:hypothetical protein [Vampirovibrionales bacterium]
MNIRTGLVGFATTLALLASQGAVRAENTAQKVAQVPSLSAVCNVVHRKTGEVVETHYLPKTYWDVLQKQCDEKVDEFIQKNPNTNGLDDLEGNCFFPEWKEEMVRK